MTDPQRPTKEKGSSLESAAKLYLARVHADSNRISEAKDLFQQVIEQDQTSQMLKTIARISLVSLLEQEQDWNGAREMLDVLSQEHWSDLQWFTQARIARQEGKVKEAKKHLQNLVNQSPDSAFRQTAETQMLLP